MNNNSTKQARAGEIKQYKPVYRNLICVVEFGATLAYQIAPFGPKN